MSETNSYYSNPKSYSKSFAKSYIINGSLEEENYMKESYNNSEKYIKEFEEKNISTLQRILLMGLTKSGKSSILKVVFQKMAPNETLFLEPTSKITKIGSFSNNI
jgi:predicted GTPase